MFRAAGTVSDVSDVQLRKAELRAQVLARRSALPADQRTAAGKLIRDAVLAAPQVQMAGTIAAYYSVGTEPDTHGLVYALWKRGSYVLLPLLRPDGDLDWASYEGPDSLVAGPRGLRDDVIESVIKPIIPAEHDALERYGYLPPNLSAL